MGHKTEFKVDVSCDKCKKKVLEVVSKIEGVNKIEVNVEKGMVTVIGDSDPFVIIKCLRKAGKNAQFVTVGPPPKPDSQKTEKEKCIERGKKIYEKIAEKYPDAFQNPWSNPSLNHCSIPIPDPTKMPCLKSCSDSCKNPCPDPCKNPCLDPCKNSCPPYPYPYPYPYSYPSECKPYAFMTMDYQDPTPSCSIM